MNKKYLVHVVPHTHWDREWYFTFEEFRYRLIKMFDRLLPLMHSGEIEYFVADGHTLLIDDYLTMRPEQEQAVRNLIAEGRILLGPWYTQPNVYMSGAEAQVRNLLRGRQEMEKYGDTMEMAKINYLPDMFGFHAQLPQMMKGFGMTHLVGARGMPLGSPNYFKWEGSDGTVVRVCSLLNSYNNGNGLSDREEPITFKVFGEPIKMPSLTEQLQLILDDRSEIERANAPQLLLMNGVDHMWANPTMKKTLAKIEELRPNLTAQQSTISRYIDAVEQTLESEPPLYKGEHRDPRQVLILPGSQSMRMDIKKYNRKMEDLLEHRVEPLMAKMQMLGEDNLPQVFLKQAWEYVLMNQAHDSLCCANSEPSYREIYSRFEKADDVAREIHTELEQRLFRRIKDVPEDAVMIFNPSTMDREGPMTLEVITPHDTLYAQPHLFRGKEEVPVNILSVRDDMLLRYVPFSGLVGQLPVRIFRLTADVGVIPATGYQVLEVRLDTPHARPVEGLVTGPNRMENDYIAVEVNADATLNVTDKATQKQYKQVHRFIDEGETGCGFMHIPPLNDPMCFSTGKNMDLRVLENNPMKGVLQITQTLTVPENLNTASTGRSERQTDITITTNVILYKNAKRLEFETVIDNTAKQHRLRIGFPTDIETQESYSGLPFDVMKRPIQPENVNYVAPGTYEAYYGYHPMHDFCGVSDGTMGAAVSGDGILEFEVLPMRNTLCMTLIRATEHLHVGVLYHGSKFRLDAAQLQGKQSYRYAFMPHSGEYDTVLPEVEAFRHPLYAVQKDFLEEESMPDYIAPVADLEMAGSFIKICGNVVVTTIKTAENGDGTIVRFYNPTVNVTEVQISVDPLFVLNSAEFVRMDETDGRELVVKDNSASLTASGKEIVTVRLRMKKK